MKTITIILFFLVLSTVPPASSFAGTSPASSAPCLQAGCYSLASAMTGSLTSSGPDSLQLPESFVTQWPLLRASGEIMGFNLIMTLYGKFIMKPENNGFTVSLHTIAENLKAGMEWDDNSFSANNFRHPYQGAMYFSAARANGYNFYESVPFSFAGAWLWEYTGEAHHPSFNDWINTSVGGIAFGEALYRLSSMVLDNTATGSERQWREVAGLLVNPVRGVNRMLTGEAFTVHANPSNRFPNYLGIDFKWGIRTIGDDRLWNSSSSKMFINFVADYGDPFIDRLETPFDHFDFGVQFNFSNKPRGIGWIGSKGALGGRDVSNSEKTHHIVAAFQHFDYFDNEAFTFGGQSLGGSFLSKFKTSSKFELRTELHLNAILLGASRSDYFNISGREYDYGPGLGFKFAAVFSREGRDVLTLANEQSWIHSINCNSADHYVNFTRAKLDFNFKDYVGLGLEYLLYLTEVVYNDLPDVSRRSPELRAYVSWDLD